MYTYLYIQVQQFATTPYCSATEIIIHAKNHKWTPSDVVFWCCVLVLCSDVVFLFISTREEKHHDHDDPRLRITVTSLTALYITNNRVYLQNGTLEHRDIGTWKKASDSRRIQYGGDSLHLETCSTLSAHAPFTRTRPPFRNVKSVETRARGGGGPRCYQKQREVQNSRTWHVFRTPQSLPWTTLPFHRGSKI